MPRRAGNPLSEYRRKRDFAKTREPSGASRSPASPPARRKQGTLRFVIQKHAASQLHFDLRLELDSVMKSWAVPKGPSLDPSVKRLAMQVEDHPIDYNSFEGTIPAGEYGGGTVMLWDHGTYAPGKIEPGDDPAAAVRRGLERGDLKFSLHGDRLQGSFALVRMKFSRERASSKPQWLLIKHRDEFASTRDIVAANTTSVTTGRTMDEIAAETKGASSSRMPQLEPMYAAIGSEIPPGERWTFEPKYDGVRVLAFATPEEVRLITRNGKDKAAQFPEIVNALKKLSGRARRPFVLDGEVVAVIDGSPARFQELQGRMHVRDSLAIEQFSGNTPAALILFDILVDGEEVLIREPWTVRRAALVKRIGKHVSDRIRITESFENRGEEMLAEARRQGWEGIISKRMDSRYEPGSRSRAWLKLKIEFRQEFVVGGYTEPRNTREHIGALLLGYFDGERFIYVGHTGGGFTRKGLEEMYKRLHPLEQKPSPFQETPRTNEKAHWVKPAVVVEVKFTEWTADRRLRQPIFLGVRDDKPARNVGRERESVQRKPARKRTGSGIPSQIEEIETSGRDGILDLGAGARLHVSSLGKIFFPKDRITKGELMRYYASVAPFILPVIADRPLVLKRFPHGIDGQSFYQQNAGNAVPAGVRVETIENDQGDTQRRFIGGDLLTLLYTVQLAGISVDPWHSRVGSLDYADYTIIDLDPGPRANFGKVVEVAHWCRDVINAYKLKGGVKTSGSSGLHIYVPLPPKTSTEAATLVAQVIATKVADSHPRVATVERSVKNRGAATVYVDFLQNIKGKTIAGAYCVRARPGAPVSVPLKWDELNASLDPRDFTIRNMPARLNDVGDIWAKAMRGKNSLGALLGRAKD